MLRTNVSWRSRAWLGWSVEDTDKREFHIEAAFFESSDV